MASDITVVPDVNEYMPRADSRNSPIHDCILGIGLLASHVLRRFDINYL